MVVIAARPRVEALGGSWHTKSFNLADGRRRGGHGMTERRGEAPGSSHPELLSLGADDVRHAHQARSERNANRPRLRSRQRVDQLASARGVRAVALALEGLARPRGCATGVVKAARGSENGGEPHERLAADHREVA